MADLRETVTACPRDGCDGYRRVSDSIPLTVVMCPALPDHSAYVVNPTFVELVGPEDGCPLLRPDGP